MKRKFCVDTLRVFNNLYADVVELVDTLALGASAARREGSSPFIRTKVKDQAIPGLLLWWSFTNWREPISSVRANPIPAA